MSNAFADRGGRLVGIVSLLKRPIRVLRGNRLGEIGLVIISTLILVAIFAPVIAPHSPEAQLTTPDGTLVRLASPALAHPLGTTLYGRDIFSQLVWGSRTALFVGFATATIVVTLSTSVAIIAGYYGGWVDEFFMRVVDIFFGVPPLAFALLVLSILDRSIIWIVMMLSLIYWRSSTRIIRSEVLSLTEEAFIQNSKITGASDFRIMYKEILPNILPLSLLYFAFTMGWAIITAASIAFLGFGDPSRMSWGRMMLAAWNNNSVLQQPLWIFAPGIMISLTVVSVYFIGRTYEDVANPRLKTGGG